MAVALSGGVGIALRVWAYRSAIGVPSSDDGVVGLMALHALHGQFTTFFWGQAYGGSQEAILTVPFFWLFGVSWLVLRIVPILLTAVTALLIWRVGRRTIGEPAASLAGALFWIWPPFAIYKLTHQNGFYTSDVFYAALLVLLALRAVERPDRLRVGVFGLVFGLAFWQSSQVVPVAVPVVAWIVLKKPRALRHLWLALPLAALGALPWLIYNIHYDWQSLSLITQGGTYSHRLRVFVSPLLPMLLGLRDVWTQSPVLPGALVDLIYVALLAGFVVGAWRSRRKDSSILYLVALAFPFVYAVSPWTNADVEPRYLMALIPIIALLVAQLARRFSVAAVLLAGACALSVVGLQRMNTVEELPSTYPPAVRSLQPLEAALKRLGVTRVYAGYELAYRLDFDTKEHIVAVMNKSPLVFADGQATPKTTPGFIRWPAYDRIVRSGLHAYAFYRVRIPESPIVSELKHDGYHAISTGPFVIYVPPGLAAR
jgi:hypothetical protein